MGGKCDNKEGDLSWEHPSLKVCGYKRGSEDQTHGFHPSSNGFVHRSNLTQFAYLILEFDVQDDPKLPEKKEKITPIQGTGMNASLLSKNLIWRAVL